MMGIRRSEELVNSEFITDKDGAPTGGTTYLEVYPEGDDGYEKPQMVINWQDGIVGPNGQNGAFVEDVIEAVLQRLRFFQASKFRCRENAIAITHIEDGLGRLDLRTRARVVEDVENTYEQHGAPEAVHVETPYETHTG